MTMLDGLPHRRVGRWGIHPAPMLASMVLLLVTVSLYAQDTPAPIIDMHLHAHTLRMYGSAPPQVCTNDREIIFPALDPAEVFDLDKVKLCPSPLQAPETDEELLQEMLEMLEHYNIRAVTTGPLEEVSKWHAAAPGRIIPGIPFDDYGQRSPDDFRRLFRAGSSPSSQKSAPSTTG